MKTLKQLYQMHKNGEKISALIVFDATFATLSARAGIDCLIVSDYLGTMVAGYQSALPVTLSQISYHAAAVARGAPNTWRMIDMPFLSYDTPEKAVQNATQLLSKSNAHMINLKTMGQSHLPVVRALKEAHIPFCIQLTYINKNDDLTVRELEKKRIRLEALMFESEGADLLILEGVPSLIAAEITQTSRIPVLGSGSGNHTSGQLLSAYDVIGINLQRGNEQQSFLQPHASVERAITAYHHFVKNQPFP